MASVLSSMISQTPQKGAEPGYVLKFGMHSGKALMDIPTDYLEWVVLNVTNKPIVVKKVKEFLSGLPQPQEKKVSMRKRIFNLQGLQRRPQPPISAVEEGDIHFLPYEFPIFEHAMMNTTYGGVPLGELHLRELEEILKPYPDPQLRDFVACRTCNLYRFFVYDDYTKAIRLDVSKLNAEGVYRFQEMMDVCREV
jgi:hypothetical protein